VEEAAHYFPMVIGAAAAILIAAIAGALTPAARSRLYRHEKGTSSAPAAMQETGIHAPPAPIRSDAAVKALFLAEHREANRLQNATLASLTSVAASLTAAFVFTACAATILPHAHGFHLFSAGFDLAAFALVIWHFHRAASRRAEWIRARAVTELLRQWSVVDLVLIGGGVPEQDFLDLKARARGELEGGSDLAAAVLRFGEERIEEIGAALRKLSAVPAAAFRHYVDRRPARQRRWFASAETRVSGQGHRTRRLLLILFGLAAAAATLKAALLVSFPDQAEAESAAMLALFVLIGLSATVTSAYLSQNARSLSHRYRTQSRSMADWFERHSSLLAAAEGSAPLTGPMIQSMTQAVREFEYLMLDELIDWIMITDRDSLEIAAA
jgi:hypothetical protein